MVLPAILVVPWVLSLLGTQVLLVDPREESFYEGQKKKDSFSRKLKIYIHKSCTRLFIATLFIVVNNWNCPRYPLIRGLINN